ncbi:YD repeat-containing protein [Pedobacter westerhofensis]|uniref:YD repeat-containing protein n=1 Tax=Pedobacter westerhofensis TaxID=425512 RepID=A0A521C614_9SPHI|nr:hypothetical protein [Pedobacter westerhofensis]SMO54879.1 YD repeat-containing protein [Pedobacter westerhofensis]
MSRLKLPKIYRCLLIFPFLLYGLATLGQTPTLTPSIDNVIPPSPNVSSINKFGSIPVGQSTGIPSISVPIYTWSGRNFGKSISISLAYHNSGVKVDETASNIGMGWALNAGGVVSRTVRGTYDELTTDGFLYRTMPPTSYDGNTFDLPVNERLFNKMNAGKVDSQCDIFNYNFNGRSGSFVLGRNGDILFLEQTKLKVEKFFDNINGNQAFSKFIITDESGYKYVFEDYELSINNHGQFPSFTSAWYLTHIYNPTQNDSVEFLYENTTFTNYSGAGSTEAIPLNNDGYGYPSQLNFGSSTVLHAKRPKKITFTDGNTVEFFYDNIQRQDLPGDFLLKKIIISKSQLSYGFKLDHDYSISDRATLVSVTPFGGSSETIDKPYRFEYLTSQTLPQKGSAQQDHWGYANNNNGGLIPHEYVRAPNGQYNPWREFPGGNRDTDPLRMLAGSMTKITYPTGGYTIFEMQANTAKDNWLEQNESVTTTLPPYTDRVMNEGLNSDLSPAASVSFVFGGETNTKTTFDFSVNPLGGNCNSGCGIKLELYNSSNSLITTQQINFSDPSADPYKITKHFELGGLVKNQSYFVKVYTINLSGYYDYMELKWRETNAGGTSTVVLSHVQPFVGGLRIKKIADFSENQSVQTKEYEYVNEDGITSSGALGFRPQYTYQVHYEHKSDPDLFEQPSYSGNFNYNYAIRTSNTVNDIAYVNGSPVTYKRIIEKITSNGMSLGKTVRYFSNFGDYPVIGNDVFPAVPNDIKPWALGLLQKEEVYNVAGELVQKTENTYNLYSDNYSSDAQRVENFRSVSIAPVKFLWAGPKDSFPHIVPDAEPHYFLSSNFTPVAGRSEVARKTVTDYSGISAIAKVINYSYDPDDYYLKETATTNSKGDIRKFVSEYPKDRAATGPNATVFANMYAKNMINTVVGEKEILNSNPLMYQWKDYASLTANLFAPSAEYSKHGNEAEERRVEYSNYDTHGNLVSVKLSRGPSMCYVWGYGGDYLIAKITNADYSTVKNILGGDAGVESLRSDRDPSDATIEALTNNLRNALPGAEIENFTYNTLAGITSHVDVKGNHTFYQYDEFGRLRYVKDQNGNIIKQAVYNYNK